MQHLLATLGIYAIDPHTPGLDDVKAAARFAGTEEHRASGKPAPDAAFGESNDGGLVEFTENRDRAEQCDGSVDAWSL